MKFEFSQRSLEESSNTRFHERLSYGSRMVPCGRTDTLVAFRNFANLPRNGQRFIAFTLFAFPDF